VALADDRSIVRRGLAARLQGAGDVELIADPGDLRSAARHVLAERPDVLVLDLLVPGPAAIDAICGLRERAPQTRIVVMATEGDPMFARRALAAGAVGYVARELADDELPAAVRAAALGDRFISPRLAARLDSLDRSRADSELTAREVEVLQLIALGHTSVEVARELHLSPRTVETHRAHIHRKLGLSTRAELVRYALGRGLLAS
jgi:two-component system response regulator NreC